MSTVQVLVAAMHQKDDSLIKRMNLQTDAIIGNQCDACSNIVYIENGHKFTYFNRQNRGVGLNRNEALLKAGGEILTFADDDMVFVDEYEKIITEAFEKLPSADAIIFNIDTKGIDVGRRKNDKTKRVRFYNCLNYGAARISVKNTSIKKANIVFHTCFGGGCTYSHGEDSLFVMDMLRAGLKIYTYPVTIAEVDQTSSTWFNGYHEKYFFDKGALFAAMSKHFSFLLGLQDIIRHHSLYKNEISFKEQVKQLKRGIENFDSLKKYEE